MKQQILVIHGGDSYASYDDYLKEITDRPLQLEWMRSGRSWKGSLQEVLGASYDVLSPYFPLRENARYEEWKVVFEKVFELLDENVILIGHSLGGIFLAKYLSEHTPTKKIKALFLVAAPYTMETPYSAEFNITDAAPIQEKVSDVFIYHSKDDAVVSFTHAERYQKDIPLAHTRFFADKGHFNMESLPEILDDIQSL